MRYTSALSYSTWHTGARRQPGAIKLPTVSNSRICNQLLYQPSCYQLAMRAHCSSMCAACASPFWGIRTSVSVLGWLNLPSTLLRFCCHVRLQLVQAMSDQGFSVSYCRIPLSRERTPEPADIAQLQAQLLPKAGAEGRRVAHLIVSRTATGSSSRCVQHDEKHRDRGLSLSL